MRKKNTPEAEIDASVRVQYEALPYPARNPEDERNRLIEGSPSHLLELNHYVFGGRRSFDSPFRALVAGGGTGDGTIMLAQHLADAGSAGEVVYVDPSAASRHIAEQRAKIRGLRNITFHSATVERLSELSLGHFDYVDCCGVLHHLADPQIGLRILASHLSPSGGLGLMVYGKLGRTGVYDMQELMHLLVSDNVPSERASAARRIIDALPASNWFRRNPFVGDYLTGGDAGIYDLLLHARDRAYTVSDILALVESCGLAVTAFVDPAAYDPDSYVTDPQLRRRLAKLAPAKRWMAAEYLAGNMTKHVFYAAPAALARQAVADPNDAEAIPILRVPADEDPFASLKPGSALTVTFNGIKTRFPLPDLAGPILSAIDGRRTIAQLVAEISTRLNRNKAHVLRAFEETYKTLNGIGRLYLHRPERS